MKKWSKLLGLGIGLLVGVSLLLHFGLAWRFAYGLTHPACLTPAPILGLDAPQTVWLLTEDGIQTQIWYYPSHNGAAILVFGGVTGALGNTIPPVQTLIAAGYGVVQVDSRACSQPPRPVTLGGDELLDAEAALGFLLNRPEVDSNRIGAIGFSMGGATALRLAARHPQIKVVVRDGGYSNLGSLLSPEGHAPRYRAIFQQTTQLMFRQITKIDPWAISPIDDLKAISPRPVLLIYGEAEAEPGLEQFEAAGDPKTLWIVPGGAHGSNHIAAAGEYERRLLDFFGVYLIE